MFENIIGHTATVAHLKELLIQDRMPQALLLSGERYSGKLTIALEAARALMCENPQAPWGCMCNSCEQHRRLTHPQLLLMGNRNFVEELTAAREALLRDPCQGTRYLFGRAVRKLMNRFNPVLWEGEERRLSGAASSIESVMETVEEIFPEQATRPTQATLPSQADAPKLRKAAELVYNKSLSILDKMPGDLLHVESIRRMNFWVHMSFHSGAKVIILEHVETLNDSQRNLLLKTLEEPPQNVHFLLTTSKRTAILPTILSRVRTVQLVKRGMDEEIKVLQRVFRLPADMPVEGQPLVAFFRGIISPNLIGVKGASERWARHLVGVVENRSGIPEEDLPGISDTTGAEQREAGVLLLRLIVEALRRNFHDEVQGSGVSAEQTLRFRRVLCDIDDALHAMAELNMNAAQVLEGLWFRENAFA
ncbi:MAG: hypothetical protein ACOC0D_09765 [Spirochaeta sp.]